MKAQRMIEVVTIALALAILAGCSSKLNTDDVNRSLSRFVAEHEFVRKKTNNTGALGYVGPIVVKENEATVDFTIKFHQLDDLLHPQHGKAGEEKAVATFNRTQDGKWILAKVRGSSWGIGWWTEPGDLNWEVK